MKSFSAKYYDESETNVSFGSCVHSFLLITVDQRVGRIGSAPEEDVARIAALGRRVRVADPQLLVFVVDQTNGQVCSVVQRSVERDRFNFPVGVYAALKSVGQ